MTSGAVMLNYSSREFKVSLSHQHVGGKYQNVYVCCVYVSECRADLPWGREAKGLRWQGEGVTAPGVKLRCSNSGLGKSPRKR